MNKFKNEMIVKLGGQEILLRPDFENIASTETNVGGIAYLAWKFSRANRVGMSMHDMSKSLPTLTECAKIIFYNQAATKPEDPTKKLFNLEEIWEMVQIEGMNSVMQSVLMFLSRVTSGRTKVEELDAAIKAESVEKKDLETSHQEPTNV